jgi:hypothetical protein
MAFIRKIEVIEAPFFADRSRTGCTAASHKGTTRRHLLQDLAPQNFDTAALSRPNRPGRLSAEIER